ncbi:hypothetical protein Peur_044146 [Populus x canadensis]
MLSKNFEVNCLKDGDIHVRNPALGDGVAECLNEIEIKKLSISTKLMNFENEFDPYGAMSTPLYHTITFKQPSAIENGHYDHTRSGNPTRGALESLLAKLDKGDRAFCFTSGMAALTAVTHLVGTGAFHSFCCLFFPYTTSILSTMPHYYLCFKISPACYGLEICTWL